MNAIQLLNGSGGWPLNCIALPDGRPIYGGFFWVNGDEKHPIPKEAYMMRGAGGQSTTIIPSHDLVIVRLGHYKGAKAGGEALNKAYTLLMEAVPEKGN